MSDVSIGTAAVRLREAGAVPYDEQWAGMADSKIFESAHHFRIESGRQFEFE